MPSNRAASTLAACAFVSTNKSSVLGHSAKQPGEIIENAHDVLRQSRRRANQVVYAAAPRTNVNRMQAEMDAHWWKCADDGVDDSCAADLDTEQTKDVLSADVEPMRRRSSLCLSDDAEPPSHAAAKLQLRPQPPQHAQAQRTDGGAALARSSSLVEGGALGSSASSLLLSRLRSMQAEEASGGTAPKRSPLRRQASFARTVLPQALNNNPVLGRVMHEREMYKKEQLVLQAAVAAATAEADDLAQGCCTQDSGRRRLNSLHASLICRARSAEPPGSEVEEAPGPMLPTPPSHRAGSRSLRRRDAPRPAACRAAVLGFGGAGGEGCPLARLLQQRGSRQPPAPRRSGSLPPGDEEDVAAAAAAALLQQPSMQARSGAERPGKDAGDDGDALGFALPDAHARHPRSPDPRPLSRALGGARALSRSHSSDPRHSQHSLSGSPDPQPPLRRRGLESPDPRHTSISAGQLVLPSCLSPGPGRPSSQAGKAPVHALLGTPPARPQTHHSSLAQPQAGRRAPYFPLGGLAGACPQSPAPSPLKRAASRQLRADHTAAAPGAGAGAGDTAVAR